MPRLHSSAVGVADLTAYLDSESDFAFELKVLQKLRSIGFTCDHGGTYEDSQTQKLRQFDIRARRKCGLGMIHLAAECKQVRENFPLLVMRTPRRNEESAHTVLLTVDRHKHNLTGSRATPDMQTRGEALRVSLGNSLYEPGKPTGRSCAQVGREVGGALTITDSEMFGKWTQAISSAHGLVNQALSEVPRDPEGWMVSIVLPVVVLPDHRLWAVDYGDDGSPTGEPHEVNRCDYYIASECAAGDRSVNVTYGITHLEFVTLSALDDFVARFADNRGTPNLRVFGVDEARQRLAS